MNTSSTTGSRADRDESAPAAGTARAWMTLSEGAQHARVSEATLRREAKAGRLRAYKVGGRRVWRLRADDIDAWLMCGGRVYSIP
jgi:excisionase family DNA binding protein